MAGSISSIGFEQRVVVGVADMAASNSQHAVLTTYALGSCLGVAMYDPTVRVGGLLHLMLPDSTIDSAKAAANPSMFADTGIPALLRAVSQMKADRSRLQVYVAGGAQILDDNGFFSIGRRNYEALVKILSGAGLRITAEAVGGQVNRTMMLKLASGSVFLKVSGQTNDVLLCRS
jgi:chemotaxis protein CheD